MCEIDPVQVGRRDSLNSKSMILVNIDRSTDCQVFFFVEGGSDFMITLLKTKSISIDY